MNFDGLIAPVVVAALVSGLVSFIASLLNRSTSIRTHQEKIKADLELAERKLAGDVRVAERKFALDLKLAELQRKTEVAEQVLADLYKARDIFADARRPFALAGEGSSRPNRGEGENDNETRHRDSIYAPYERLTRERDFFSEMHSRRFRFMALFGENGAGPFYAFVRSYNEVGAATSVLLNDRQIINPDRLERYEKVIGWGVPEEDEIAARLNQAIAEAETICGPLLRESADV